MSDQYLGEVRPFACTFAPQGFAFCNGQMLAVVNFASLFALLGTRFGGDGTRTFGLPNLQGAAPMGSGSGQGLTSRVVGDSGGAAAVALSTAEMPLHTHTVQGDASLRETAVGSPAGAVFAEGSGSDTPYSLSTTSTRALLDPQMVSTAGGSQPHNNMMPYLAVNFCIALQGNVPPRQ